MPGFLSNVLFFKKIYPWALLKHSKQTAENIF